jgi:hypothetical protein
MRANLAAGRGLGSAAIYAIQHFLVRGTGGSNPVPPASESRPSPEENHSFAPSDRDRLGHNFFCGNTAGR